MHDRVAEVLAERASLDRGAAAGLALAVVLHAGATAAIVYAALHHPAPELANVLTIKFAPAAPAPIPAPRATVTPPTPPKAVEPAPKAIVPEAAVPEVKPKAVPLPVKNTAPPDAFGRSTKKPAEVPLPVPIPQPAAPATIPGVARSNDIAPGTSGVTGIEGGDFPYTIYIDRMKNLIGTHWFRPQGASATATVHFVINRDGSLHDVTLETPSGNGTFDRAVLRAVTEASPLPPLPFAYSGSYLGVHLTFK